MNRKSKLSISIILIGVSIVGIIVFKFIDKAVNENPEKIRESVIILKEKMEEKYGIVIINSEGYYTNVVGYGATLTTENGITFDAWSRPNLSEGSIDFYMEEVWRKKGLDKWGYADQYISNVENIDLNVEYRGDEPKKDIKQLSHNIEDVKDDLWLTLYIDLQEPFQEEKAKEIQQGIYNYYQRLQKDDANGVELIVRYDENSLKQDTGSYMISRDENGKFPIINKVESVSNTFNK